MKILNFGSLNIDYTYKVPHFVGRGETLAALDMKKFPGGKGLNQSVALGRSGAEVYHAGAVGMDDGEFLAELLKENSADTRFIRRLDMPSGHAIIQNTPDGDNCILICGGANRAITREMVDETLSFFGEGDFLVLQNEISSLEYLMDRARENGMRIVLNPSPFDRALIPLVKKGVYLLMVNEVEAAGLCGTSPSGEDSGERSGEDGTAASGPAARDALIAGIRAHFPGTRAVLTLGGEGACYIDGDETVFQPAFPVKAVDTTAAGDTFTGYFVGALAEGRSPAEALKRAAAAAAISVTKPGAAPSVPGKEEVEAFLAGK